MFGEVYKKFGGDNMHRIQAIFSSIFVMQNRMQTAGDKIQTRISMKQWLLLAMADSCPPPRTLTNVGSLMGCSRQNVKKLAVALEEKGFIRLLTGSEHGLGHNSVCIELTEMVSEYAGEIGGRQMQALTLLFQDFSEEEIEQLYNLYAKLYAGIERVEEYAARLTAPQLSTQGDEAK